MALLNEKTTDSRRIYLFDYKKHELKAISAWLSKLFTDGIVVADGITLTKDIDNSLNIEKITFNGTIGSLPAYISVDTDTFGMTVKITEEALIGRNSVIFTGIIGNSVVEFYINLEKYEVRIALNRDDALTVETLEKIVDMKALLPQNP